MWFPEKGWISSVLASLFPGVVLFVLFPIAVYLPNADEFHDHAFVLKVLLAAGLLYVLGTLLLIRTSGTYFPLISKALFFFGCLLLLNDVVAPVLVGEIDTGNELKGIFEPPIFNVLQFGLLICFFLAIAFVPWSQDVRSFCSAVAVLVPLAQIPGIANAIFSTQAKAGNPETALSKQATTPNVLHVVFDSYGPDFIKHAEEAGLLPVFDGFTLFPAYANADYTELSFPSFMSGTLPNSDPRGFNYWLAGWEGKDSLLGQFQQNGYRISEYQAKFKFSNAHNSTTFIDVAREIGGDRNGVTFLEMVLLRAAPNFLKQEVFPGGRGVLSSLTAKNSANGSQSKYPDQAKPLIHGHYSRGPTAISLIDRIVADEPARSATGEYVFGHVLFPHSPYNVDRDLEVRGVTTSFTDQSIAAVRLMARLIEKLKSEGRYKDTLIVFHGDHGLERSDKEFADADAPAGLFKSPRTLLLVKPSGTEKLPLKIALLQAQLVDVAPTLLSLIAKDKQPGLAGFSLISPDSVPQRDVQTFSYVRPVTREFRMMHFVRTDEGKWTKLPDLVPVIRN